MSIVVYWMMIFWLKEGDTCVNGSLLNDDTPVDWMMIFWLKQSESVLLNGD